MKERGVITFDKAVHR